MRTNYRAVTIGKGRALATNLPGYWLELVTITAGSESSFCLTEHFGLARHLVWRRPRYAQSRNRDDATFLRAE